MKLSEWLESGHSKCLLPEDRLIFLCARTSLSEDHLAEIAHLIEGKVSWESVLHKGAWHRLSALLYFNLNQQRFEHRVPEEVMRELEEAYYQNLARNLYYQDQLGKYLSRLEEEGISSIVLKGGAIAQTIYGDMGLRAMNDLDVMVQEDNAERSYEVLMTLGFSPLPHQADSEIYQRWKNLHHHYPVLVSEDGLVPVEIHRGIVPPGDPIQVDIDDFWKNACDIMISGSKIRVLSPEHLVIHLSIHSFRSLNGPTQSGGAWGQLCDISEVILHHCDTFNWGTLVQDAKRYGVAGVLYSMLDAVSALIRTKPPDEIMDDLRPEDFNMHRQKQFINSWILRSARSPILELMDLTMQPTLNDTIGESSKAWFRLRRIIRGFRYCFGSLIHPTTMLRDIRVRRWVEQLQE